MKLFFFLLLLLTTTGFHPRKLKWVALGDSITYLNDHADETGNRITKGYMTGVVEQLPNIEFSNKGYNGWTAVRIADSIETLGLRPADIYTVFLGTNDWWQGRALGTMDDYRNNTGNGTVCGAFRTIINKLRSLNSKAHIILLTPMQRVDFVYINDMKNNAFGSYRPKNGQWLEQFAVAIDSIGKFEHIDVVDTFHEPAMSLQALVKFKRLKDPATGRYRDYTWPDYVDVPFNPETDGYPYPPEAIDITYDGLHPSDKGYGIITGKLVKLFQNF